MKLRCSDRPGRCPAHGVLVNPKKLNATGGGTTQMVGEPRARASRWHMQIQVEPQGPWLMASLIQGARQVSRERPFQVAPPIKGRMRSVSSVI